MAYKTDETLLLRYLGSSPVLRIADFFLDNPLSDYSKSEVCKKLEDAQGEIFQVLEGAGEVRRAEGDEAEREGDDVPAGQREQGRETSDQARYGDIQERDGEGGRNRQETDRTLACEISEDGAFDCRSGHFLSGEEQAIDQTNHFR